MNPTKFVITSVFALALGAETAKQPDKVFLPAGDALAFTEAAALSLQQQNEVNRLQVQLEQQKAKAADAERRFTTVVSDLRRKMKLADDCQIDATGQVEPDKKYAFSCPVVQTKK